MKRILIAAVLACLLGGGLAQVVARYSNRDTYHIGTVRIAYVGRLTGSNAQSGVEMQAAVADQFQMVNHDGGVNGLKVDLVSFDDQGEADTAKSIAQQIAADTSIVAVIGHSTTTGSLAAGPIYAENEVPAIAPRSTAPEVTENNPWYFRAIFSDDREAAFLGYYARDVLNARGVAIVSTPTKYAERMEGVMREEVAALGLPIRSTWKGDPSAEGSAQAMAELPKKLASLPPDTVVMLLAGQRHGVPLVKAIRDAGINLNILGCDLLGTAKLSASLTQLPHEQTVPGFYTSGLFVAAPFLPDTANLEARNLIRRLAGQAGGLDNWGAPYAYDAAKIVVEAMRRANFGAETPANPRRAIREQLDLMRTPGMGVHGATGLTWFDSQNNGVKPVTIGQFSSQLMSSLMQLHQSAQNPQLVRVPVVYAGLTPRTIALVPGAPNQADVTFDLWFRYQGDVPVDEVSFSGAVSPVSIGAPVKATSQGGINYRLHRVNARFQVQTGGILAAESQTRLSIAFHHPSLTDRQIIFVPDATAFPSLSGDALRQLLMRSAVLPAGMALKDAVLAADTLERSSLGDPSLGTGATPMVLAPGISLTMELQSEVASLRRRWLDPSVDLAALFFAGAFIALMVLKDKPFLTHWPRAVMLGLTAITGALTYTAEGAAVRLLVDLKLEHAITEALRMFDLIWWIVTCSLLLAATNTLGWIPMEKATGRPIPKVVKTFVTGIILVLTLLGILSNVFQRDVTGLMATSGLVAMIFGLALQSNLANVFSGIALNLERPIRPGDWIKIGDNPVSRVIDISWRATKVQTLDNTMVSIPNSVVTGVRLENFSFPEERFMIERPLQVPGEHDPSRVMKLIEDALLLAKSADRRDFLDLATVHFNGTDSNGNGLYSVRFDCVDRSVAERQSNGVMLNVQGLLRRFGILKGSASTQDLVATRDTAAGLLAELVPFSHLPTADRDRLEANAIRQDEQTGHTLFSAGEPASHVYLIAEGVLSARRLEDGDGEMGRFGPGMVLGLESLHEQAAYRATVVALTPIVIHRIDATQVLQCLKNHEGIMRLIDEMIARDLDAPAAGLAPDSNGQVRVRSQLVAHFTKLLGKWGPAT